MRFLLFILLLSATCAHARLGETRAQSEARYGLPKSERVAKGEVPLLDGARELTFHHAGFRIRCALLLATDGVEYIVREEYSRITILPKITELEHDAMMEAELNGLKWTAVSKDDEKKVVVTQFLQELRGAPWLRTDGAVLVIAGNDMQVRLELPQARKWEGQFQLARAQQQRAAAPKF
jgi:hypothetical protein